MTKRGCTIKVHHGRNHNAIVETAITSDEREDGRPPAPADTGAQLATVQQFMAILQAGDVKLNSRICFELNAEIDI